MEIQRQKGKLVLTGSLTIVDADMLREALMAELAAPGGDLTLDMTGVEDMDVATIQLVWAARLQARKSGRNLHIAQVNAAVSHRMGILGLDPQEVVG
ncbi:MAG: STAS domain-containing protein [Magnetococcus sp. WYHC-3]